MKKNFLNKKKLLIVGGTGFIGYYLSKICINKFHVSSLSLSKPTKEKKLKKVKYITCDISKKNSLEKKIKDNFNIVVNLGGYINHKDQSTIKAHYNGCKNLVNFFQNKKLKIFIQIGSSSEYGKKNSPHLENLKGRPTTIYGKSKLNASKYLFNFSKKKKFPFSIIRFYQIYGPKQNTDRIIPMVINSSLKNQKFSCSSGLQNRDFLYVTDAASSIFECFNNTKILGKIINIGSGRQTNIKILINSIKNKIKKGKPLFGSIKLRADEPIDSYPDLKNAKKYLKWKPRVKLELGLSKTIEYFKNK